MKLVLKIIQNQTGNRSVAGDTKSETVSARNLYRTEAKIEQATGDTKTETIATRDNCQKLKQLVLEIYLEKQAEWNRKLVAGNTKKKHRMM